MVQVYMLDSQHKRAFIDMTRKSYFQYELIYDEKSIQKDSILVTDARIAGVSPARVVIPYDKKENIYNYVEFYEVSKKPQDTDITLEDLLKDSDVDVEISLPEVDAFADDCNEREKIKEAAAAQAVLDEKRRKEEELKTRAQQMARESLELAGAESRRRADEEAQRTLAELHAKTIVDSKPPIRESAPVGPGNYSIGGYQDEQFVIPSVPLANPSDNIVIRKHRRKNRIYAFYSATNGCGASTVAYSLACNAAKTLSKRVLLIDLDVNEGGLTNKIYTQQKWEISNDGGIHKLFTLGYLEFMHSIKFMVMPYNYKGNILSFLRGPVGVGLRNKVVMSNYGFSDILSNMLSEYDMIFVDMGVWNPQFSYQAQLLTNPYISNVAVVSNRDSGAFAKGISYLEDMPRYYSVIVNKAMRSSNVYTLSDILDRPVLGMLYNEGHFEECIDSGRPMQDIDTSDGFINQWDAICKEVIDI